MEKLTRLTEEDRDNMVAYLDGELDEATARQMEKKLASSQVARHEVDLLSRTWELLDVLPRAEVSEEFTRQTLSMALVAEAPPRLDGAWVKHARRGGILTGWAAGLALAAWLGFWITHDLVPNPARQLLEDLPVIEKLDIYAEVGSVEFLRELYSNGSFDNEQQTAGGPDGGKL